MQVFLQILPDFVLVQRLQRLALNLPLLNDGVNKGRCNGDLSSDETGFLMLGLRGTVGASAALELAASEERDNAKLFSGLPVPDL